MAFALFDKVRIDGKGVNGSIVDIYTDDVGQRAVHSGDSGEYERLPQAHGAGEVYGAE